jgi:putative sarcalumenin
MKKTRFTKTLFYGICSFVIAAIIFLAIGYFGKEESVQKNDSSQSDKKQEQVSKPKDSKENKVDNSNNQSVKQQEEHKIENKNLIKDTGEEVLKTPNQQDYKGKKLSDSEGVGTTGKIFKSQKEALDFGRKEVRRLVNEDKKPRQFSISKVTAEDGSLVGWTVDVFEDNDMEKVVSNPSATEENKE